LLLIGADPPIHFRLLTELVGQVPELELAGLALSHEDADERALLQETAQRLGVPFYENVAAGLKTANAVVHLGPYGLRGRVLLELLTAPELRVLLVDKPLAISRPDLELVERSLLVRPDVAVWPLLSLRADARYRLVQRLYAAGLVGEARKITATRPHRLGSRPRWFFQRGLYPSIVADLCVHDVDAVRFLTGLEITSVEGTYEVVRPTEGRLLPVFGSITLWLENQAVAHLTADWLTFPTAPYHGACTFEIGGLVGRILLVTDGAGRGLWVESSHRAAEKRLRTALAAEPETSSWEWQREGGEPQYFRIFIPPTDYGADFRTLLRAFLAPPEEQPAWLPTAADLLRATRPVVGEAEPAGSSFTTG